MRTRRSLMVSWMGWGLGWGLGCTQPAAPPESKAEARPAPADTKPTEPSPPDPARPEPTTAANVGAPPNTSLTFDKLEPGTVPPGWTVGETNGAGKLATWAVVDDPEAPSPPRALAITKTENEGQTYNMVLVPDFESTDVDIRVMLRAEGGVKDRGGGVVFRARGFEDYYVARWNPIEKNVRFYVVEGSHRSALAKAEIDLDPAAWHSLRVVAADRELELYLDDTMVLRHQLPEEPSEGKVGLWTKADAATWFDDFSVSAL